MMKWNDKRYHSLDYDLKERFGQKVYKVSLDAGFTCPNRDGTIGRGGCIFCSEGGSGDFASSHMKSITGQIEEGKERVRKKTKEDAFIAYFQAFTNTYGPVSYLREIFMEAIHHPDIVALSIATRPDCLPDDVITLLDELNQIKPVFIELGFQTSNEKTAAFIRRGYDNAVLEEAVAKLDAISIPVILHIILGLPYETKEDIRATIEYVCSLKISGLKLQLMHILKNTELADLYEIHPEIFHMMDFEAYLDMLIECISIIPEHIVLHRITGDGPKNLLIAPLWSGDKKRVFNTIQMELARRDIWQGKGILHAVRNTDAL
ncbi:MAG: TIGR01212 family radical SAM protein [Lachnospiraceae bacterium]|nr:TIGR01212 family radical SAM protein [Lachnospiraceae bacterium]